MLIERQIEEKIKSYISNNISDCEVIGSWSPADSGTFKGETKTDAKAIISIFVQPRKHDSFSLPTVSMSGMIAVECRCEMCPTMSEVSEIYEKVIKILDDWHYDGQKFSNEISTDDFFATEIMLSGGDKVQFDRNDRSWIVSMGFTIAGSVIH